jgi:glycosyltransferase involved in cell wall biosynthesis
LHFTGKALIISAVHVSVIATVFNEASSLPRLLDSLAGQTRRPEEVVIADGGSTDDTLALLERYAATSPLPLQVLSCPGSNISQGRNAAIRAAAGPIIAVTDGGVRIQPDWLEKLVAPIEAGRATAAGFFQPDPHTPFEIAMGATILPAAQDIDPATFLPSSRSVAFLKEAWQAVGGYPEWLDYCEDLILDFYLRDRYGPFAFVPEAVVGFRPRSSWRTFFLQYYRYARGDGKADLWRLRHAARYGTYLLGIPLIIGLSACCSPWFLSLFVLGGVTYTWRPVARLQGAWDDLSRKERLTALALVPLIRLVGDLAKMIGYPAGVWWRLTSGQFQDWRRHLSGRPDPRRR